MGCALGGHSLIGCVPGGCHMGCVLGSYYSMVLL